MGALLGEHGGGGTFAGYPVGNERKALETGISLHGGSVGQPGVGLSTGDFENWLKGFWRWDVSLCGSSVKGPGGRAPLLGTLENRQKRLWRWASISIGALLGNLEGGSYNGDVER